MTSRVFCRSTDRRQAQSKAGPTCRQRQRRQRSLRLPGAAANALAKKLLPPLPCEVCTLASCCPSRCHFVACCRMLACPFSASCPGPIQPFQSRPCPLSSAPTAPQPTWSMSPCVADTVWSRSRILSVSQSTLRRVLAKMTDCNSTTQHSTAQLLRQSRPAEHRARAAAVELPQPILLLRLTAGLYQALFTG